MAYRNRIVDEELAARLRATGAVLVEGPKEAAVWAGPGEAAAWFAGVDPTRS